MAGINYQSYSNYLSPGGGTDWGSLQDETQGLMSFGQPFGQSPQATYDPTSQGFSYGLPSATASSPLGLGSGASAPGISTPQTTVPTLGNSASTPATSPTAQAAVLPTPLAASSSAALPSALATNPVSAAASTGAGPSLLPRGNPNATPQNPVVIQSPKPWNLSIPAGGFDPNLPNPAGIDPNGHQIITVGLSDLNNYLTNYQNELQSAQASGGTPADLAPSQLTPLNAPSDLIDSLRAISPSNVPAQYQSLYQQLGLG